MILCLWNWDTEIVQKVQETLSVLMGIIWVTIYDSNMLHNWRKNCKLHFTNLKEWPHPMSFFSMYHVNNEVIYKLVWSEWKLLQIILRLSRISEAECVRKMGQKALEGRWPGIIDLQLLVFWKVFVVGKVFCFLFAFQITHPRSDI